MPDRRANRKARHSRRRREHRQAQSKPGYDSPEAARRRAELQRRQLPPHHQAFATFLGTDALIVPDPMAPAAPAEPDATP